MNTCCDPTTPYSPKIVITGSQKVRVQPFHTIEQFGQLIGKLGRIASANAAGSAMRLSTATGDLIASVQDGHNDIAEEAANVIIAAAIIAIGSGINADQLAEALRAEVERQAGDNLARKMSEVFSDAGFDSII